MKQEVRYWDSDCFLAWLKDEPNKAQACEGVVRSAEKGEVLIVTAALTLAEVIKLKRKPPVPPEHAEKVREFFKKDFIEVRNVDRRLAEVARELVWEHELLDPKDAIHVATAIDLHISILDTFDGDLIKLTGVMGNPPLRIGIPNIEYQPDMFPDLGIVTPEESARLEILFRKFESVSDRTTNEQETNQDAETPRSKA